MIKNEKQFRNTVSLINKLKDSLAELSVLPTISSKEKLRNAQLQALKGQIMQFEAQTNDYLALKTHKIKPPSLMMVHTLPSLLIQWRIYEGLTQKQLAAKLGWHYQQLQDYEKSDYATATLQTIKRVANVLSHNRLI